VKFEWTAKGPNSTTTYSLDSRQFSRRWLAASIPFRIRDVINFVRLPIPQNVFSCDERKPWLLSEREGRDTSFPGGGHGLTDTVVGLRTDTRGWIIASSIYSRAVIFWMICQQLNFLQASSWRDYCGYLELPSRKQQSKTIGCFCYLIGTTRWYSYLRCRCNRLDVDGILERLLVNQIKYSSLLCTKFPLT